MSKSKKMKVLYGTGNPAKLDAMRRRLEDLPIDIIGLKDINGPIPNVVEDGKIPLDNARIKATAYYDAFQMPVFSCDSGLYFDDVDECDQPGVHVRTIDGKYLSDEEMIIHYTSLAQKYKKLVAHYKNAICLVMDKEHIYEAMDESMESERFIISDRQHSDCKKGFPLDSISIDIKSGKYYYDLPSQELDILAVERGFLDFFENVLKNSNLSS